MDNLHREPELSALADGQLRAKALRRGVQAASRQRRFAPRPGAGTTAPDRRGAAHRPASGMARRRRIPGEAAASACAQEAAVGAALPPGRRWPCPLTAARPPTTGAGSWWPASRRSPPFPPSAGTCWGGLAPAAGRSWPQHPPPCPAGGGRFDRGPMMRDPRLDQLLAAHRQLGGATALQEPRASCATPPSRAGPLRGADGGAPRPFRIEPQISRPRLLACGRGHVPAWARRSAGQPARGDEPRPSAPSTSG
jgi:sigma-E factor negative regulatory protein RseA